MQTLSSKFATLHKNNGSFTIDAQEREEGENRYAGSNKLRFSNFPFVKQSLLSLGIHLSVACLQWRASAWASVTHTLLPCFFPQHLWHLLNEIPAKSASGELGSLQSQPHSSARLHHDPARAEHPGLAPCGDLSIRHLYILAGSAGSASALSPTCFTFLLTPTNPATPLESED